MSQKEDIMILPKKMLKIQMKAKMKNYYHLLLKKRERKIKSQELWAELIEFCKIDMKMQ